MPTLHDAFDDQLKFFSYTLILHTNDCKEKSQYNSNKNKCTTYYPYYVIPVKDVSFQ